MIQASELTKYYGRSRALERLSFSVHPGEIVGLVGRNGAGKSTALLILSCQLLPTAGEVSIDGLSVTEFPREVRRRIGFLPERLPLYPEMTVTGYLRFAARLRGLGREEAETRSRAVMEQTGLVAVAGERLGSLSRGFQQRVGIAQAIVHDPRVVLLDEPMTGLDPLQIAHVRELILSLKERHTVLFSSHILSEITNVCDRVMLIDQGSLRAEGAEQALREQYLKRRRLLLRVRGTRERVGDLVGRIPGLSADSYHPEEQGTLAVRLSAAEDLREQLSRACVEAGLGLLELRDEAHGLEELFVHLLNSGEET